jgi:streptogramin lyase
MRSGKLWLVASVSVGALLLQAALPSDAMAQNAALSGGVSSAQEPVMEGVLVSLKKEGSSITTTVATNDKGQYTIPADRLEPGKYTISIRAVGYVIDGPKLVEIPAGKDAKADIKLNKTRNVMTQLTNAEWLNSAPGSTKDKAFMNGCTGCHTLQRIFMSSHTAEEWKQVFARMEGYAQGSQPQRPSLLPPGGRTNRDVLDPKAAQATADYFASISLNGPDAQEFDIKTEPRPKGRATNVIITEYDMPRKEAMPHDVVVDAKGQAWYSDFGSLFVGELDPKTGKVTDYKLPEFRPNRPHSTLDLELDPNGNLWISMMYQAGVSMIDVKTKEVKGYPYPDEWVGPSTLTSMVSPTYSNIDNKVWSNNQATREQYRLDLATGTYENLGVAQDPRGKRISGYGMPADRQNNVFMLEFSGTSIGRRDKNNYVTIWPTPTAGSRPRRGRVDEQNHLWFAQYAGNAIAMLDTESGKMQEWPMPNKYEWPYDVVPTKSGEAWTGSMTTDLVTRLNAKTGEIVQYLLPRSTNIRRVFVEETGARPVFWVGNNNGASIIKLEPLD